MEMNETPTCGSCGAFLLVDVSPESVRLGVCHGCRSASAQMRVDNPPDLLPPVDTDCGGYLLFAGERYEFGKGGDEFKAKYATVEEARRDAQNEDARGSEGEQLHWYQIVDAKTLQPVEVGTKLKGGAWATHRPLPKGLTRASFKADWLAGDPDWIKAVRQEKKDEVP
jgi:hypothetical protein